MSNTPTRPGWYWFLPDDENTIAIKLVEICKFERGLFVHIDNCNVPLDCFHGDWEPIEPPPRMVAEVERRKNTKENSDGT